MTELAAVLPELVALEDRDVFITGIEVFLDSIESVAERERAGRDS